MTLGILIVVMAAAVFFIAIVGLSFSWALSLGLTLLSVGTVLGIVGWTIHPGFGIAGLILLVLGICLSAVLFWQITGPDEDMGDIKFEYAWLLDDWKKDLRNPDFVLNHPAILGHHPAVEALRYSARRVARTLEGTSRPKAEAAMQDMNERWWHCRRLLFCDPAAGLTKHQRKLLRKASAKHQKAKGTGGIKRIELEDERDAILAKLGCGRHSDLASTKL